MGLEVHAQLLTHSKLFCSCSTEFGAPPNENTCPICVGMPGVLPVLNRKAVDYAIKTALAMNCTVAPDSQFARKNYFYPDLPKGYQISQYEQPLSSNGSVEIEVDGRRRQIGIIRIHIEEDAGKLVHGEDLGRSEYSYVDMNRCGVPLIEIVSAPDLRTPEEAKEYMTKLRAILQYLEVCDGNMEQGSLRCDANISIRPVGSSTLGTKTEIKNMNSFRHVQRALEYEIQRQTRLLEEGERIVQETRLWNADQGVTLSMRSKEEAHDYRYFPEPDLVPCVVVPERIKEIHATLPELPDARRQRFVEQYGIPAYDAGVLTATRPLANYFEETVRRYTKPKAVSNWVMVELLRELKGNELEIERCPITPERLAELLSLIDQGVISGKIAKAVFEEMYRSGKQASEIIQEKGMTQISDQDALSGTIDQVLAANAEHVSSYLQGKEKVFGYLVGQVMKATQGRANPELVNRLLREKLQR
ncbi:MAG: Asp-tRNA(Asn)/Glu-tRNA(Gln) amidotransferase subunit GatB [Candidatus Tectomicrobia bacterium]|uniref:Aspartyl/glutamyl-tRNA(Asn/Gln) amidotransferase subunit B n=1 Tax=Tectimicrobiota bacterium TaxID=2528274 RepID=A0A932FUW5_UNCTE|nr:Asp-tRNA(Asn)/Glu-tRNA(Gln) amidotransferase subunit GatB [Candidatus Tectomicrobia bacterium]